MTDQQPPYSNQPHPTGEQPTYPNVPQDPQSYGPPPQGQWQAGPPQQPDPQQPPGYQQPQPPYGPPAGGYSGQQPGYGQPPQQPGYGQPPYEQAPYGTPPGGGYGPPPQPGYGPPTGQPPVYNGPPPTGQQPMYGGPPAGYGPDYLSAPQPPQRRSRRGLIIGSAAVVIALGISGGAYAVLANKDGGKGKADLAAQYIPSDSIAVMSANLSPGGSETVEALKFFRKFPEIAQRSTGNSISTGLIKPLFDNTAGVDYGTDIQPWLGDNISIAAEPQGGRVHPVVAIQVKDVGKARTTLTKYTKGQSDIGFVFRDKYAIISDSTSAAQHASNQAKSSSIRGSGDYNTDIKALPSDSVLNAWVNVKQGLKYGQSVGMQTNGVDTAKLPGRFAFGLRFQDSTADLQFRAIGTPQINNSSPMGEKVGALPDDTSLAVGLTDGDKIVANAWPELQQLINSADPYQLQQFEAKTGLTLPGDLETLVGSRTVIAMGSSTNKVGIVSTTKDPQQAAAVAQKLGANSHSPISVKQTSDGVVMATSDDYAAALQKGGSLGDQDAFKRAVPDAAGASFVMYGDISKLASSESDKLPANARTFKAFGLTASSKGNVATAHLRLVLN